MSRAALEAPPSTLDVRPPTRSQPSTTRSAPATGTGARARCWLETPVVACALLFVIYGSLSLLNDPRGTLLADSGGKLATLHVMSERGSLDPDVGYWAAAEDPEGTLHPLEFTTQVGGKWLQATTLPMLYASYPLYELGGDRAVLALPILGAVLCALAARSLARRYGSSTGWTAFWAVGLLTPVALYALAFWEHTIGLAFVLWAFVVLVDVSRGRAGWRGALGAGALFGAAAVMRTEALVYFAVTMLAVLFLMVFRNRAVWRAASTGVAVAAGALFVVAVNHALEIITIGDSVRVGRTAGAASAASSATLADRLEQATTTATGLNGFTVSLDWVAGAAIVLLIGGGAWCLARAGGPRLLGGVAIAGASMLYALRFGNQLGYVPGLFTASPLAAAGVVLAWGRRDLRLPTVVACLALPLIWATQWSDPMRPQWGGRYALASGALLAVVAVVVLAEKRVALSAVLALAVLVTGFGIAFLVERSHSIADGMETLVDRNDEALISLDPHVLREGGAFYEARHHWLTAGDFTELRKAVRIVTAAGDRELALVLPASVTPPRTLSTFVLGRSERLRFRPDEPALRVATYYLE